MRPMSHDADPITQRSDGPTPNGGVAAVITYFDAEGKLCPRSRAVTSEINELDKSGESIFRTYGQMRPADHDGVTPLPLNPRPRPRRHRASR